MRVLVERLTKHPQDVVNWEQKNPHGIDFISSAAHNCALSTLFPLVRELDYFADGERELKLTLKPWSRQRWEEDWGALESEDKCRFRVPPWW